jgi:hypothetical protein
MGATVVVTELESYSINESWENEMAEEQKRRDQEALEDQISAEDEEIELPDLKTY